MEPKQVRGLAGVHGRCPKLSVGPADPLGLTSEQAGLGGPQKAPCCCCLEKPLNQSLQECDQGKTQKRAWYIHSNQQQLLLNFCGVFWLGFLFLFALLHLFRIRVSRKHTQRHPGSECSHRRLV